MECFRLIQAVINNVRNNNLVESIKRVSIERSRNLKDDVAPFSVYRDILFLVMTDLGTNNVNMGNFNFCSKKKTFFNLRKN